MYRQEFIDKLKEPSIRGWHQYKILPSLTIAQAILETGWGKSNKVPNNLFGIKADSRWTGEKVLVDTKEEVNGKTVTVKAWFRIYKDIYESLEDRYKFLQAIRYKKIIGEADYKKACQEIYKAGYATDSKYPKKLIDLIEQYKLYEIDKLAFQPPKPQVSPWAQESWKFTVDRKYLDGTRAKDNLTREEMALVLFRMV